MIAESPTVTLESKQVTMLVLAGAKGLDPIRVITEDFHPGAGRIIIVCYARAWVGYWGAMSGKTVSQFFTSCDACYLLSNLTGGQRLGSINQRKSDESYLTRIIEAVQAGLRKHAAMVPA